MRVKKPSGAPVGNTNAAINDRTAESMAISLNAATMAYVKSLPARKGQGTPKTIVMGELYESGLHARDIGAAWLTEPTRSHAGALRLSVRDCFIDGLRAFPADGSRAREVGRLMDLGYWFQQQEAKRKTAVNRDGCIVYEGKGE